MDDLLEDDAFDEIIDLPDELPPPLQPQRAAHSPSQRPRRRQSPPRRSPLQLQGSEGDGEMPGRSSKYGERVNRARHANRNSLAPQRSASRSVSPSDMTGGAAPGAAVVPAIQSTYGTYGSAWGEAPPAPPPPPPKPQSPPKPLPTVDGDAPIGMSAEEYAELAAIKAREGGGGHDGEAPIGMTATEFEALAALRAREGRHGAADAPSAAAPPAVSMWATSPSKLPGHRAPPPLSIPSPNREAGPASIPSAAAGASRPLRPERPPTVRQLDATPPLSPLEPAPRGQMVQCVVRRRTTRGGLGSSVYMLFVQYEGGREEFVLAARKRHGVNQAKGASFLIAQDVASLHKKRGSFVAKLRSNFLGTEWMLYDDGGLKPRGGGGGGGARMDYGPVVEGGGERRRRTKRSIWTPTEERSVWSPEPSPPTQESNAAAPASSSFDFSDGDEDEDGGARGRREAAAPATSPGGGSRPAAPRRELSLVCSSQNVLGPALPRKIRMLVPWRHEPPELGAEEEVVAGGGPSELRPTSGAETLASQLRALHFCPAAGAAASATLLLESRDPDVDPATGARSLNFGRRVTHASVKNFQVELVERFGEEPDDGRQTTTAAAPRPRPVKPLILQFGKCERDAFALDFRHPLSPVQAFALGLTALARKLSSEGG